MGELTWDEGLRINRDIRVPHSEKPYRTFRWGRDLQIWLTDGRDFRSRNSCRTVPTSQCGAANRRNG